LERLSLRHPNPALEPPRPLAYAAAIIRGEGCALEQSLKAGSRPAAPRAMDASPYYRPDIDGVRAVAVSAVVVFHAFPRLLPGGFVGVDVFFVISGFLITQIVRGQIAGQSFSFLDFYERRIRRLFPALVVVVAATALAALIVLPPGDMKAFGRSIGPSMLFAANFHFSHKVGYFAPPDDVRPLLHLWSLAVEEQFYLVWPLLLWLGARFSKVGLNLALVAIVVTSLVGDEVMALRDPMTAFYFTPLRAWEPLIGAMLGMGWLAPFRARWLREAAAALGLAAIAGSVLLLNAATPFPGLAALPACLGAGLLLQTGRAGAPTLIARVLTLRPVVYVGALAYSLYLWHWPVLTFLRLGSPTEPPAWLMAGGLVVSLGLAALTQRYVERPYRRRPVGGLSRRGLYASAFAALAVAALCGEALAADEGLRWRAHGFEALADQAERDLPQVKDCEGASDEPGHRCDFGVLRPGGPDLILWGDSQSITWEEGAADWASRRGLMGRVTSNPACAPVLGVDEHEADGKKNACIALNTRLLDQVRADPNLKYILIVARLPLYEKGPDVDHPSIYLTAVGGRRDPARFHDLLAGGLTRFVDAITAAGPPGLKILILEPTPEFAVNPPRCAERAVLVGRDPTACLMGARPPMIARQAASVEILQALARTHPDVRLLNVNDTLCQGDVCHAEIGGRIVYRDADHLTATGGRLLGPRLFAGVG
jgi:peptidoglycan/LPS O-acetylase OafA/YrhL